MEWEARFLNNEGALRRLESQLGSENFQLLITGSYGDILPNLALLKAFHQINGGTISVLIGEHWRPLAERFNYNFIKFYFINISQQEFLHAVLCSLGRPLIRNVGYLFPTLPTLHPWIADFILSERVTDYEAKRTILGLAVGTKMDLPSLKPARSEEIFRTLSDLGIRKSKSVLLSFHSNSNPMIDLTSQLTMAQILLSKGLEVVYNIAGSNAEQKFLKELETIGVKLYNLPPDAPIEIVEYFGTYVGSAHGLTVILASFPCNARIVQVAVQSTSLISNNGRLISADSLRVDQVLGKDLLNSVNVVNLGDAKTSSFWDVLTK